MSKTKAQEKSAVEVVLPESSILTREKTDFGAIFQTEEFGGTRKFRFALTSYEAARVLLFAAGSIEEALECLSYESRKSKEG